MNVFSLALATLLALMFTLSACGQKGPLYLERVVPPPAEGHTAPPPPAKPAKPTRTTVEPASKDNTATELPPVSE